MIGLDGQRVIIFGGTADPSIQDLAPGDSLYALNLINFEWYIPKTSGHIPQSRMFHKANVIRKYMVITFGKYYIFRILLKLIFIMIFIKNTINFNRTRL